MLKKRIEELNELAKKHPLYLNEKCKNVVLIRTSKYGMNRPEYLFIGEAPGFKENEEGIPFIGRSGQLLEKWIKENKIRTYAIINTVPLIPLNNEGKIRKPTKIEIEYFKEKTEEIIKEINPKNIIALGKSALNFLETDLKVTTWTKKRIANKFFSIGFQYHPSYYLRNGNRGILEGSKNFKELIENNLKTEENI